LKIENSKYYLTHTLSVYFQLRRSTNQIQRENTFPQFSQFRQQQKHTDLRHSQNPNFRIQKQK